MFSIYNIKKLKVDKIPFCPGRFFPPWKKPDNPAQVALKAGRRKVPGSTPGCACQPSRTEFSVVITETGLNTG